MNKEQIQNLIKDLIEKTTLKTNKITVSEDGEKSTWFSVEVNEPHFFIRQEGEAIYALNHLIHRIIETQNPILPTVGALERQKGKSILVDINSFQKKKIENIRAVAHMMSERARYFKSNIEVDPMSAFERRIVHEFLAEAPDLETQSTGFGRQRRVVIKYLGSI